MRGHPQLRYLARARRLICRRSRGVNLDIDDGETPVPGDELDTLIEIFQERDAINPLPGSTFRTPKKYLFDTYGSTW